MLELASAGRGAYTSLGNGSEWQCAEGISDEQARVVEHLLKSKDLVTSVRGPAGSGKTTMMQEAVEAIAALSGKNVIVAAPSSSAVGILKKNDFSKSDTVQRFRLDELLQEAARGQLLWVDGAGFLSALDMRWLVEFASKNDCRLILSGDTRQHHLLRLNLVAYDPTKPWEFYIQLTQIEKASKISKAIWRCARSFKAARYANKSAPFKVGTIRRLQIKPPSRYMQLVRVGDRKSHV